MSDDAHQGFGTGQSYLLVVDPKGLLTADAIAALTRRCAVEIDAVGTPESVAHHIGRGRPDVVLVGIDDEESLHTIQHIPVNRGRPRLIGITSAATADVVAAAMRAGCDGFIVSGGGGQAVAETVAATAVAAPGRDASLEGGPGAGAARNGMPLTDRERQVLSLVSEGHPTKQIASMLSLSGKTVETHRLRIMRKLRLYSVAELTKYAIRHGLTQV